MNRKIFFFMFFLVLIMLQKLYGINIQNSDKELSSYFTFEYNRALNYCWDISTVGSLKFKDRHIVKSGLAMGGTGNIFNIKGFIGGETSFFTSFPVNLSLNYSYNGLPAYENHTHSILFLASIKRQWWGVSAGTSFRFTSFFGEPAVFEPILSFLVYVFFINNDTLKLGLRIANFDNFTSGNMGAYFLNINSSVRLSERLSLINEIEILQSGSIALASNFYGIVYKGGVTFSW